MLKTSIYGRQALVLFLSSNDCKIPGISMVNEALKFSALNRIIDTYILIKTGV